MVLAASASKALDRFLAAIPLAAEEIGHPQHNEREAIGRKRADARGKLETLARTLDRAKRADDARLVRDMKIGLDAGYAVATWRERLEVIGR